MKKTALLFLIVGLIFQAYTLRAEESSKASASATPEPQTAVSDAPAPVTEPAPAASSTTPEALQVPETSPAPQSATATPSAATPVQASENLEFVSGEITAIDEAAKTVTVKLYGETENATNDKILTVKLDETTDITDGEKDRDIKSLTNGTEVDVEYDPATNKATYIFVY